MNAPDLPQVLPQILRLIFALTFVLALMGLLHIVLRRVRDRAGLTGGRRKRLSVIETLPLDGRRKLVLVKRDGVEHLVILGTNGETVIERGIESGQDGAHENIVVIPSTAEGRP